MVDYNELFNLCGLNDEWQAANKKRIETFLDRIHVRTPEDIQHAIKRTKSQYDTDIEGVRGLLAVCMKETMDFVLAKDEHEIVINVGRPMLGLYDQGISITERKYGGKFYARGTAIILCELILGTVFDKANWLIDIAEDNGQTADVAHCSQYQIWQGGLYEGVFPIPDVEIAPGIFCDQAPETEHFIAAELARKGVKGYRVIGSDITLDHQWKSWPNIDPVHVRYMGDTMDRVFDTLRADYGFDITTDDMIDGMVEINEMTGNYLNICELMSTADPQPISQADLHLIFYVWGMGTVYCEEAAVAANALEKEVRRRIREGFGVTPKGAPRIYTTYRYTTDLTIFRLIEEIGFNHCLCWFDTFPSEVFDTPTKIGDRPDWLALEAMHRMVCLGDNYGTAKSWAWFCKEHNLDGFVHLMPIFCRPYCEPCMIGRETVQKEAGVPVLVLEADGFDSRNFNYEQMRTRLESFYEVLVQNKEKKLNPVN